MPSVIVVPIRVVVHLEARPIEMCGGGNVCACYLSMSDEPISAHSCMNADSHLRMGKEVRLEFTFKLTAYHNMAF